MLLSSENRLMLLLALAEASLLLDRLAVGFLAPFLGEDLHLSNFQLGLLSSMFSLSFALSAYVVGSLSDRSGSRWSWLIGLILMFSFVSAAAGISRTFVELAVLRVALGALEGPFLPIALALMGNYSTPRRRSFNLGFVQNVGAFVFAQLAGPIVLVWYAVHHGWRAAFVFTAVPGPVIAAMLFIVMRLMSGVSTVTLIDTPAVRRGPGLGILRHRNIRLSAMIAACMGSWILLQMTFLPKYLVQVAGMTPTHMSFMMSVMGIGGCASSLFVPMLSDKWGRRPTLMAGTLIAVLMPAGVLLAAQMPLVLTAAILLGSIALGCSPLYTAIIPSDTVDSADLARAIGFVSGCSAVVGGIAAPSLAGLLADNYGLQVAFWVAAALALTATALSALLQARPSAINLMSKPKERRLELGDA